ncbi:sugar phosphate isomerase/epimerase family protein [Cohnella cellulosilytica]|uniref:Sugar phosphate isomerase/epimerase family protein n=1 Tax=Cohnella cellulosilytica TaxID=986710 RepID=A0ABW2F8F6_9BACL
MKPAIAVQLFTLRDLLAADFWGVLTKVKEMGYAGVEWAGLNGHSAAEAGAFAENLGLASAAMHVGMARLQDDLPALLEEARQLRTHHLVCSSLPKTMRDEAGYKTFRRQINEIAEKVKSEGFTIGYHNHDFELGTSVDGSPALAYLLRPEAGNSLLAEVDLYWVRKGGCDPLSFIQPYANRMPTIHLKDMSADESQSFAEVGSGVIDFAPILKWCERSGVKWYVVEQDICRTDPMECIRTSLKNLHKLIG